MSVYMNVPSTPQLISAVEYPQLEFLLSQSFISSSWRCGGLL